MTYEFAQADALSHTASVSVERSNDYNSDFSYCASILRTRDRRRLEEIAGEQKAEERRRLNFIKDLKDKAKANVEE